MKVGPDVHGDTKPGSAKTSKVCARHGCRKHVTALAILHGDRYCSRTCFQLSEGFQDICPEANDRRKRKTDA